MTITQVGTATQCTTVNVGITPTGVQAGDVLIASLGGYNNTLTPGVPDGWSLIQSFQHTSTGDDNIQALSYYYVCGATTPATHAWFDAFGIAAVIMTAWRGVDNVNPIDTFSPNGGGSANPTGASITTFGAI